MKYRLELLEMLGKSKETAIHLSDLATKLFYTERNVKYIITRLRAEGYDIQSAWQGYWLSA